MNTFKYIAATALLAGTASPAFAEADTFRPYIEGQLGLAIPSDVDYNSDAVDAALGTPVDAETSIDNALSFGAELGLTLAPVLPGLRTSLGIAHRSSDFDDVEVTLAGASTTFDAEGDVSLTSLQGNLYYDIDLDSRFTPFVGGGLGVTWAKVDSPDSTVPSFDDTDASFSWSLMTGLNFEVTDNILVGGKYRFTRINGFDLEGTIDPANLGSAGPSLDSSYETDAVSLHEVLFTVAYRF